MLAKMEVIFFFFFFFFYFFFKFLNFFFFFYLVNDWLANGISHSDYETLVPIKPTPAALGNINIILF